MTPFRSRPYLDLAYAPHARCMACGAPGPCDPAHFNGMHAQRLGRGTGQKAMDLVAPLCRRCHESMDAFKDGNDAERAALFLAYILQWLHMNLSAGHVELVVHTEAVPRTAPPERVAGRRRKPSRCTAAANQYPRPPSGFSR